MKGITKGTVKQKPKLPNYRKSGGLALATFTGRSIKLKDGMLRFPMGSTSKTWFGIDAFYLPMPSNLDFSVKSAGQKLLSGELHAIREIKILPRNRQFYAEFVYQVSAISVDVDKTKALGIDHGLDNWLTCISNLGTSVLVRTTEAVVVSRLREVLNLLDLNPDSIILAQTPQILVWVKLMF